MSTRYVIHEDRRLFIIAQINQKLSIYLIDIHEDRRLFIIAQSNQKLSIYLIDIFISYILLNMQGTINLYFYLHNAGEALLVYVTRVVTVATVYATIS